MTALIVNGERHSIDIAADTPLLYVLRDDLRLNGAKYGCGLGQCGACTVLIDGEPAFSCLTSLADAEGRNVTTVEGLGTADAPGIVQRSFIDTQAAQCGYCLAGMIVRTEALLRRTNRPSENEVRDALQPGLCRCGTHMRILEAVRQAARTMGGGVTASDGTTT